jgi:hypothetical protein
MRRLGGGFEIKVAAPTLGLITRVASDEPDPRAATVASNVRFEKGVVKNAKGFVSVSLNEPLDSPVNLIFQTQFYNPASDVGIIGTARKIYSISIPSVFPDAVLTQLYDFGNDIASSQNRISAATFFNRVVFAQVDSILLQWYGTGTVIPVIGLDPTLKWKGVNVFRDYVLIWNDSLLQWCATDNMDCWIPVGETATSALLNTIQSFTMPEAGDATGWIFVDSQTASLLALGQFMSMQYGGTTSYFQVSAVAPITGQNGQVAGYAQGIPAGQPGNVYINSFVPYQTGEFLYFQNNSAVLQVSAAAIDPGTLATAVAANFNIPSPGGQVTVSTAVAPQYLPGTYVSVGVSAFAGSDIYLVVSVNSSTNTIILQATGVGFTGATVHYAGEIIVPQPFVAVTNTSAVAAAGSFATPLLEYNAFQMEALNLTGVLAQGTIVPSGTQILSVDANGAGALQNAGVLVNGPILWCDTLGDYGYIFKNRSIQSMQYVGIAQGTFFIRPQVTDEGLIGRYSFAKVGLDTMYIFGNREFYRYAGGSQLVPIGRQHSVEVFAELDRTRADEIIGYHNEQDFEIGFVYPVAGTVSTDAPYRVFIYNYVEDSCTIDDYDPSVHPSLVLHGITALSRLKFSPNITWAVALGTWVNPGSWPASATWQSLFAGSQTNFMLAGFQNNETVGNPTLAVLNQNYDRDGVAMLCQYETPDMDGGDSQVWKYGDTLMISLQTGLPLVPQANPFVITVQLGSRNNLDDAVVWSNPVNLNVNGDGNVITKVNIQRSGRYLRVRINSNQAGCGWRISKMTLNGRTGSVY